MSMFYTNEEMAQLTNNSWSFQDGYIVVLHSTHPFDLPFKPITSNRELGSVSTIQVTYVKVIFNSDFDTKVMWVVKDIEDFVVQLLTDTYKG